MTEVCSRSKYGFCKKGKYCDKIHFNDTCNMPLCTGEMCDKRHPVTCFYFDTYGMCKFGSFCAYFHFETKCKDETEETTAKESKDVVTDMENKVNSLIVEVTELKTVVKNLTSKLEKLEETERLHQIEKNKTEKQEKLTHTKQIQDLKLVKAVSEKDIETSKVSQETVQKEEISLDEIIRQNSLEFFL